MNKKSFLIFYKKYCIIYIENQNEYCPVAQLAEQRSVKPWVVGSSPTGAAREAIISLMLKPKRKTKNWVIPQLKMRRVRFPRWREASVLELREEVILIG